MHCVNCGVQMTEGSGFCPNCGKSAGGAAAGSGAPMAAPGSLQSNVAGLLCYLAGFITGIFFLVAEPYKRDKFVRFHAFQAIFLSAAWIAWYVVLDLLLAMLPLALWRVTWMLSSLVSLGFLLLALFLMFKAYNNEQFKLPVIGDLAAKQA